MHKRVFTYRLKALLKCLAPVLTILLSLPALASAATSASPMDVDELFNRTLSAFKNDVSSYQCIFNKKELVGKKLIVEQNIIFKFMKPGHFYLKWTEGKRKGQESIFVKDKYKDKVKAHPGGFLKFISVSLNPEGSMAMKGNRHSILEAGIGNIIKLLEANYLLSKSRGDGDISYIGTAIFNERAMHHIRAVFPEDSGYYGHIINIYFDKEHHMPVWIEIRGWEEELLEEYSFLDIELNVPLTEADFDTKNPKYKF